MENTIHGNWSFRQRVSSPTYEVDSPTSKCQFANAAKQQNTGPLLPLHAYQLFLVLLSPAERNKPLNMCTQNLTPYNFFYSSFFHPRAIQLIPRSFIHCRAKRKSVLDIGFRSDWHISVGELTFDVGESTFGELVVHWRTNSLAKRPVQPNCTCR